MDIDIVENKHTMKELKIFLYCLFIVTFAGSVKAIEPEPDWSVRYQQVKSDLVKSFSGAKLGEITRIELRVGGDRFGRVNKITTDSITLNGKTYSKNQLTPASSKKVFVEEYATPLAREQIRQEREDYRLRKNQEVQQMILDMKRQDEEKIRKADIEARQSEAKFFEEQARCEEEQANALASFGVALLIVIGIVSLLLYFVPSFIAFIRGHHNTAAIVALNILLGWTFLGWVAALVWSVTRVEREPSSYKPQQESNEIKRRFVGKRVIIKGKEGSEQTSRKYQ